MVVTYTGPDGIPTPVDLEALGITSRPLVRQDFDLFLGASVTSLHPAIPDEQTLPFGGVVGNQLGFIDPARPGDSRTIRATLSSPLCPLVPIKGVQLAFKLQFLGGSGSHLHQSTDVSPTFSAAGLGTENVIDTSDGCRFGNHQ